MGKSYNKLPSVHLYSARLQRRGTNSNLIHYARCSFVLRFLKSIMAESWIEWCPTSYALCQPQGFFSPLRLILKSKFKKNLNS